MRTEAEGDTQHQVHIYLKRQKHRKRSRLRKDRIKATPGGGHEGTSGARGVLFLDLGAGYTGAFSL